jgi:hypothetical protein
MRIEREYPHKGGFLHQESVNARRNAATAKRIAR